MDFSLEIIIILLMLIVNAIFASYEMALASVARARLMALVNLKKKGASEALFMKDRMEASLAVVQLGITLSGAIAAATGGAGVDEYLSPLLMGYWGISEAMASVLSLVFLILPLSCLTIVFAELIPKIYAIKHPANVCLFLSPFMKGLAAIAYPLINLLEMIVKKIMNLVRQRNDNGEKMEDPAGLHELQAAVALARTSRLLGAHQEKIVLSAAQLSTRPIKDSMIPIADISMIPLDSSLSQALIQAHNDMHTRFPVHVQKDGVLSIEGYVNFKDIIAGLKLNPEDPSIKGIMRPIKSIAADMSVSQALEQMMAEKLHIAIVVSAQGASIGMITLEDIIEELVGEIEDEYDRIPAYIHPYGTSAWLMGGGVTMAVISQTVGQDRFPVSAQDEKLKLADWFSQKINKPLKGGESLEVNDLQFVLRKLRRKKLGEAIVMYPVKSK